MATKQVIVMRKDLHMRRGKEIAQGAHAALAFLTRQVSVATHRITTITPVQLEWMASSYRKVCVRVNSEAELMEIEQKAREAGVEVHVIVDSGLTEFNGVPTPTCLALGPDYDERIDAITGHLELY